MAISYPVSTPTDVIGIADIQLSATNAVAVSKSPFTFATQVHAYSGEMWSASVTIPTVRKELAEPWVAFLLSLRGQYGTFLLGDPNRTSPQGTATSATITGSLGDRSVTVAMTGTLKAGDYLQLGSGSSARLHKVLVDKSGNGTLEIWPALRANYSSTSATLTNAKGVFRLASNSTQWGIGSSSAYSIQFDAMEDI
jgi:hypothetical protein